LVLEGTSGVPDSIVPKLVAPTKAFVLRSADVVLAARLLVLLALVGEASDAVLDASPVMIVFVLEVTEIVLASAIPDVEPCVAFSMPPVL
jgi:hypothetical protein